VYVQPARQRTRMRQPVKDVQAPQIKYKDKALTRTRTKAIQRGSIIGATKQVMNLKNLQKNIMDTRMMNRQDE